MENFIIIIPLLLIGIVLKRIPAFSAEMGTVVYISLPALILLKIPALVFSKDLLIPAIMSWFFLGENNYEI